MATYTSNYAWTKPSGGDPVDIEVLNDNLDDQDSIVHQAFLDLAPVFSTSNTYAVKDVVLYDNKVWICHTAVTTAGAWTGSTNWTQTTVGETGGVGTYADLPDKPSINGNELSGNKTGAQLGLQNVLTFDNVPTANSNNPVKSGGVYAVDEAIRQWTTAEAKSASGNPITLTDGSARNAEGLSVTCNPKQNLHGYDHPWAGGAGKNKLPLVLADIKSANTSGTWSGNAYTLNGVTYTLLVDDGNNITGIKANGATTTSDWISLNLPATSLNGSYIITGCPSGGGDSTYMQRIGRTPSSTYYGIETGNGITLNNVNDIFDVHLFVKNASNVIFYPMIRLASESDATFAPYSNECPITGYTECVVDDHGENFFANLTKDTNKGYIDNYYLTSNGSTAQSGGYYVSEYLEIKPNTAYYIGGILGNSPALCYYDSNKTYISGVQYSNNESITDTSPSNAKYMRLSVLKANESLYMVRYASAIDTATITFGQTVYGGSVDFKTGKVTVTHASIASYNGESINEPWLSSIDEYVSGTTPTTGAQVVYPLTTPTELTLTPAELELLKGYNYITTNGTTIALDYLPDSLLAEAENYVDAKIPPAPSSDGTYVLTCTVTDGTPAYSWESAT